jgi:NAD(P)-dependent dehydrogenase (short-subunit alcohol dehydrogenase family)
MLHPEVGTPDFMSKVWFVTGSASGLKRNIGEVVLASKSHQCHSVSR